MYGTGESPGFWILKLDSLGFFEWDLIPDPDGNDDNGGGECLSVCETPDAGIVAGGIARIYTSYNIALMRYGTRMDATDPAIPDSFALLPSIYPNPFNAIANIEWLQARSGPVNVSVYDVLGRLVSTLTDKPLAPAGKHVLQFDGQSLSSGSYFLHVKTPDYSYRQRVLLLK